ncbi:DoxX family protein [Pedobacter cryoconitis]|uniref:DoxX-like protein n=1 Tax=Pedobacter cryoconitis TaxID=188932 RepID=A0A327T7U4_9SPHI|nr:DoxX family protein [Pedobacter cryoconitis]RAJ37399.1 DoxX-like protein [Pedobacter cryoconitis]
MINLSNFAQLIIALSICLVWIGRFDNIVKEFKQYGIPDLVRNMVGATKIALSTLLVVGIWYESPVFSAALLMALLMICAQIAHLKVRNPLRKFIPSFILLMLSIFVAGVHSGYFFKCC